MADRIKGITVEIGGDMTDLSKALTVYIPLIQYHLHGKIVPPNR